jgi:FkbM family methyltransferase
MSKQVLTELHSLEKKYKEKQAKKLSHKQNIWIFGTGQFGRDLHAALSIEEYCVAGFVETTPSSKEFLELPLLGWKEWSSTHFKNPLCIGIFNRNMPLDQLEGIARQNGAADIYMPWDLYPILEKHLGWRYWLSPAHKILSNLHKLSKAIDCLSDEFSKRCILDIAAFRLGMNTAYGSFQHEETQYFNTLTLSTFKGKSISFVEGGAYTGDTYLTLCKHTNVYESYLFEPDADNYAKLVSKIDRKVNYVHCLPIGLWDSYGILSFNEGNGEGASISGDGTAHIATVDLDSLIGGRTVDFIKLDVEGSEMRALYGAKNLIKHSRPVLAVSLYHRPEDLWELPLILASLCDDYMFYIRQHYANSFDSVLYAIPNKLHTEFLNN